MKRDTKPFVVEVKRGTRRSSFIGLLDQSSTMSEAQRRAEVALFAGPASVEPVTPKVVEGDAFRRILPSLVETHPTTRSEPEDVIEARKTRRHGSGRRPGSSRSMTGEGEPDGRKTREPLRSPDAVRVSSEVPVTSNGKLEAAAEGANAADARAGTSSTADLKRSRLRERSIILARYVLGTKPAPGDRWKRSRKPFERTPRKRASV